MQHDVRGECNGGDTAVDGICGSLEAFFRMNRFLRTLVVVVSLVGATVLAGCASTRSGAVHPSGDDSFVLISAGQLIVPRGPRPWIWYLVDRDTRTCWLRIGESINPLDCCALTRVAEARETVHWVTPESCEHAPDTPAVEDSGERDSEGDERGLHGEDEIFGGN